jgi:hypothetical protein
MIPQVYLLHFSAPLGNPQNTRAQASHYLGWALDVASRLAEHRAGRGAAITRAAVERGIDFDVVASWPGDRYLERRLKNLKATPRLCPVCGGRHPRGRLHFDPAWEQLSLLDPFDVPAPPAARIDWYEISLRRRWAQFRPAPATMRSDLAEGPAPAYHIPF